MSTKIYTLIENEKSLKAESSLINEFGFSLYIEDEDFKFIFDTGQTGEFINNAKKMGIDLKDVKNIVLSHSHYDHTGGVKTFVEKISPKFTLHINETFFDEKYKTTGIIRKFLGNNFTKEYMEKKGVNIHYIKEDIFQLSKNVKLHTNFKTMNDFENLQKCYIRKIYDNYILDNMEDEIALTVDTPKGLFVIVGCSHIGIANIIENIKRRETKKIYGIIGGLHLKRADEKRMDDVINYFIENDIQYFGVCHCTGEKFIEKIKKLEYFKDKVIKASNTGDTVIL